jgi:hypothetical protein
MHAEVYLVLHCYHFTLLNCHGFYLSICDIYKCMFIVNFLFLDLKKIAELQGIPIDLEPYVKKLNNSRRRVMLVNNILQNAQVLVHCIL